MIIHLIMQFEWLITYTVNRCGSSIVLLYLVELGLVFNGHCFPLGNTIYLRVHSSKVQLSINTNVNNRFIFKQTFV